MKLPGPGVSVKKDSVTGEVVYIDRFGNLITNIARREIDNLGAKELAASIKNIKRIPFLSFYGQTAPGKPLAIMGSCGLLELSINKGTAAERLKAGISDKVVVRHVKKK